MMKKVLLICTGNSCRSIIAEALINAKIFGVEAKSAGVHINEEVNPLAKKLLESKGIWKDEYHSKTIDKFFNEHFDLLVTLCDFSYESCPIFPRPITKIHVGFTDPDGEPYKIYEELYKEMEYELLPRIKKALK
ncbi:MAG: arsenate reductase [Sulfurovum sp. AS07-7]|jgi:arsenate reductase|nr:MAG: arsenate reductase [Sulfurovum sp. AS07-7]